LNVSDFKTVFQCHVLK